MKDKKRWFDITKFFEASRCSKFGVVEPLAYPGTKTNKGRFDCTRFFKRFIPFVCDMTICLWPLLCYSNERQKKGRFDIKNFLKHLLVDNLVLSNGWLILVWKQTKCSWIAPEFLKHLFYCVRYCDMSTAPSCYTKKDKNDGSKHKNF